jgi:hypothetical protein
MCCSPATPPPTFPDGGPPARLPTAAEELSAALLVPERWTRAKTAPPPTRRPEATSAAALPAPVRREGGDGVVFSVTGSSFGFARTFWPNGCRWTYEETKKHL